MEIFYRKNGRRYEPVSIFNSNLDKAYPKGAHLIIVSEGWSSKYYKIDPDFASMIAAGKYAKDAIASEMVRRSEARPSVAPLTPEQIKAWNDLKKAFGQDITLMHPSINEVAEAGVEAMQQHAEKLLSNPSVKAAWDNFMMFCKLAAENENA